ncbi:hypothetical protein Dfri01_27770 [Dyadobacter frigoris]|nr:hypothetical protein Dfri01_27770 [Dyadobacter frigoris]
MSSRPTPALSPIGVLNSKKTESRILVAMYVSPDNSTAMDDFLSENFSKEPTAGREKLFSSSK